MNKIKPLIVIVGPTASGKTGLAIRIAKKINGEIICADSRTVYKYMDIGTAKPTFDEMNGVAHWGIDLLEPDKKFTVKDFKDYAEQKISEIRSRNMVPILVGGSGLYVDSIIFDYDFSARTDNNIRSVMQDKSVSELREYCIKNNISLPENDKNKRYILRAIEAGGKINRQ
jgi:tRNA dimethylallyltransferase